MAVFSRSIVTECDLETLHKHLDGWERPFTVTVSKGVKRTNKQNRLQRKWLSEITEQWDGQTIEEVRAYCKLHFGVPILRRDNDAFHHKYDQHIKPLPYETKIELMMEPISFPVTRLMNTVQKNEYIETMFRHFSQKGFFLTDPKTGEKLKAAA